MISKTKKIGQLILFILHFRFPLTTSYCHGTSNMPLIHETIGSSFLKTVEKYPDKEAVVFCETDTRKTFSQFWTEVMLKLP